MLGYVWCGTCFFFSSCVNRALVMIGGSSWCLPFWRVNNQPKPWNLQIDWNSLFYATSTLLWGDPSSTSCQHAEHIRQLGLWTAFTCCSKCLVGLGLAKQTRRTGTDVQQQKRSEGRWHSFLSIAIYQPCIHLLFGAVPFGRRVVVAQKGCLDSRFALIRQQQPQAGNALVIFFQFEYVCFTAVWDIITRMISEKSRILGYHSALWTNSEAKHDLVPKLDPFFFLPCWTVFLSDFSNMNIIPELSSVPDSGKWLWFVPMFHFHYVPGVNHAQKKPAIEFARVYIYCIYDINDIMMYMFFCVLIDWRLRLVVKMESSLYEYKKPILRGKTPAHLPVCRCSEGAFWGADGTHGERKVDLSLAIWSAYSIQDSLVKVLADLRFMTALVWE